MLVQPAVEERVVELVQEGVTGVAKKDKKTSSDQATESDGHQVSRVIFLVKLEVPKRFERAAL